MVLPRGEVDDELHGRVEQLGHEDQEYGQNQDRELEPADVEEQAGHGTTTATMTWKSMLRWVRTAEIIPRYACSKLRTTPCWPLPGRSTFFATQLLHYSPLDSRHLACPEVLSVVHATQV